MNGIILRFRSMARRSIFSGRRRGGTLPTIGAVTLNPASIRDEHRLPLQVNVQYVTACCQRVNHNVALNACSLVFQRRADGCSEPSTLTRHQFLGDGSFHPSNAS
jgi:hypothetical protein